MKTILTLFFIFLFSIAFTQGWSISKSLFSIVIDDSLIYTQDCSSKKEGERMVFKLKEGISATLSSKEDILGQINFLVTINNATSDTITLENMVPFGESSDHIYITSTGPWALARAKLFRPGKGPIGLILPDNAWELGYGSINVDNENSIAMLARRKDVEKGKKHRYISYIYPGGSISYSLYQSFYEGAWQNGLRKVFRDHKLFEMNAFENSLFERDDLRWIKGKYLIALQFAWDKDFYDWSTQEYTIENFLEEGKEIFGGYDVYGLWPTWPRLGVDERNQWNMFESLPGGLNTIKSISRDMQEDGTSFFICYNPWDESTKKEDPYKGMARLIEATDANGVVLDCHGWSQEKYQRAADSIKDGVIMYSEGMAVIKDMPGIISGRVHNAIYQSPPLNLNKLIKPDFSIFRVLEPKDKDWKREICISFFNGYGTEINYFAPGRPDETLKDFPLLASTVRILRENTSNFQSENWTPLINSLKDSIWINKWPVKDKTLYTIYSLVPEGYNNALFEIEKKDNFHFVSLLRHEEVNIKEVDGKSYAIAELDAFNKSWIGSRKEGSTECIARLPEIIKATILNGNLLIEAEEVDKVMVWAGDPTYQGDAGYRMPGTGYRMPDAGKHKVNILEDFGDYQGKFVIQAFKDNEMVDEKIVYLEAGTPEMLTKEAVQPLGKSRDMVVIPGGTYRFKSYNNDQFIPYPGISDSIVHLNPFYMDVYPVTNKQYYNFIKASGYIPADTTNYLKHWKGDKFPEDLKDHPVVYVDVRDAQAYANWTGKRLPTEAEWQYAAQGIVLLKWPWGNEFDSSMCNNASGKSSSVYDHPEGKSPFGIQDMTGNVWQLTSDIYFNGNYYFVIMKGGSFYMPTSSWWYIQGGPQGSDRQQMLLLVNPGLNRNSTVGFRCAKAAE